MIFNFFEMDLYTDNRDHFGHYNQDKTFSYRYIPTWKRQLAHFHLEIYLK